MPASLPPPLSFPRLAVGTMNFGARTPEPEATRIVGRAFDLGLTFFDTANLYDQGESERILGRALKGRRHQAQIATKAGLCRRNGKPEGLSPETLKAGLEESLQRLGTEVIDLFYFHAPDAQTPLERSLEAIQVLLEQGKILAWGVSNFASWQILELMQLAASHGMPGPAVSQVLYNLLVRELEIEYFAFARAHPIHTTIYNPLAGGLLARPPGAKIEGSRLEKNPLYRRRYGSSALQDRARALEETAREEGLTLLELAYAWVAHAPGVDSVLLGPASVQHLDDAVKAVQKELTPACLKRVNALHQESLGTDVHYAR